jgi:ethanolamine utilization protein EutM
MNAQALGLIETVGLPAAVEAADAALKAAHVSLIGYEKTKGGGLIVVKLCGDVGAIKAAVEAGVAAAQRVNKVYAWHVIPRPHSETGLLVQQTDRGPAKIAPETPAPAFPERRPASPKKDKKPKREKAKAKEVALVVSGPLETVIETKDDGQPLGEFPITPDGGQADEPPAAEAEAAQAEAMGETLESAPAEEEPDAEATAEATCNLCSDPACPRRKGQPYKLCIHWTPPAGE